MSSKSFKKSGGKNLKKNHQKSWKKMVEKKWGKKSWEKKIKKVGNKSGRPLLYMPPNQKLWSDSTFSPRESRTCWVSMKMKY